NQQQQQLSLQEKPVEVHLMIQNCYMYLDSILCNILAVTYDRSGKGSGQPLVNLDMFSNVFVLMIICVNASCGLSTSYFIKTVSIEFESSGAVTLSQSIAVQLDHEVLHDGHRIAPHGRHLLLAL